MGASSPTPLYRPRTGASHSERQRSRLFPNSHGRSNKHRSPSHRSLSESNTSPYQMVRYGRPRGKGGESVRHSVSMSNFEDHGPLAPDRTLKGGTIGTPIHRFVEAKANIAQQPGVVFE